MQISQLSCQFSTEGTFAHQKTKKGKYGGKSELKLPSIGVKGEGRREIAGKIM